MWMKVREEARGTQHTTPTTCSITVHSHRDKHENTCSTHTSTQRGLLTLDIQNTSHMHTHMLAHTHDHLSFLSPLTLSCTFFHKERFFILVEFASEGSLLSHLKQMRKEQQTMSWSKGLNFALQIANGMMHLASKEVCC